SVYTSRRTRSGSTNLTRSGIRSCNMGASSGSDDNLRAFIGGELRYQPIDPKLFIENRKRLAAMMAPNSLAVVNANDLMPRNPDALSLIVPQTDLFYLTGIEQEETILLMCPNAFDEKLREVLFVRESSELLTIWEGHKLTKQEAQEISGIKNIKLLSEFRQIFHRLMCEVEHVCLNSNEHARS